MIIDSGKEERTNEFIDYSLKDFIKFCLRKWVWIAVCLIIAIGIGLFYIYTKQPEYKRFEQILVNDQDSDVGVNGISNAFSTLGLFSKNTNVYNELLAITSPATLYAVADSLHLDMNYVVKEGLRKKTLYGSNLPFYIEMKDVEKQGSASFRMKKKKDGQWELYKFQRILPDRKIKYKDTVVLPGIGTETETPIGVVAMLPNPSYRFPEEHEDKVYYISKLPLQTTVELYGEKLSGDLADQDADVIELIIEDVSVERATDILNYIIIVYNQNWVDDKNRIAIATSKFIDERLKVIYSELKDVDQSIAGYMKKTGTFDIKTSTEINMELGGKLTEALINESNQLEIARYMKEFLSEHNDITSVLPLNLGIESPDLAAQIASYNELLINRNTIVSNSSEMNPLAEHYASQLKKMRSAIDLTINNRIEGLQTSISSIRNEINKNYAGISGLPEVSLPLLSEERQQSVKESLYLFLLQKKEENELTQKFSADNIRVITPPMGPLKPVAPRKALIIVISGILGLFVPIIVLYFIETSDTTIRGKTDLESLTIPFTGEIPQVGKKLKLNKVRDKILGGEKHDETPPLKVVEEGKRDIVNEAFRVVRGNIDFMIGNNSPHKILMLTSFNPGSGKSFITYNLAMCYALKHKKTLIIDCDLRRGSASLYAGNYQNGLTDILSGSVENWKGLIVKSEQNSDLFILPVGKIPPNPTELLENGKLAKLIEESRKEFDIVLLDCPPIDIVADTQIVSQMCDRTLFIIRAGLFEKTALKELETLYQGKRFNNLSLILNGTEAVHSRYYVYGNYQNPG